MLHIHTYVCAALAELFWIGEILEDTTGELGIPAVLFTPDPEKEGKNKQELERFLYQGTKSIVDKGTQKINIVIYFNNQSTNSSQSELKPHHGHYPGANKC